MNTAFVTNDETAAIQNARKEHGLKEKAGERSALGLRSMEELLSDKHPPERLVQGLLDRQGLSYLYGPYGGYKSFMGLGVGICVAAGSPFCDRNVQQGLVVILAGEGNQGYRVRLAGMVQALDVSKDLPLYVSSKGGRLDDEKCLKACTDELSELPEAPALIIVDTQARWSSGDENSSQDAGCFIEAVDFLKDTFSCHVMVVHHTGKRKGEMRGSSAFPGAADTILKCQKTREYSVILKVMKNKDGKEGDEFHFKGRQVILAGWMDEFGQPRDTLVFEPSVNEKMKQRKKWCAEVVAVVKGNPTFNQSQLVMEVQKITGQGKSKSLEFLKSITGSVLVEMSEGEGRPTRYRVKNDDTLFFKREHPHWGDSNKDEDLIDLSSTG